MTTLVIGPTLRALMGDHPARAASAFLKLCVVAPQTPQTCKKSGPRLLTQAAAAQVPHSQRAGASPPQGARHSRGSGGSAAPLPAHQMLETQALLSLALVESTSDGVELRREPGGDAQLERVHLPRCL